MIRTFIAIDVPNTVKTAVTAVQNDLRRMFPRDSVRWTRSEGIHLTLKFLGDVPEAEIPRVIEAVKDAAVEVSCFELVTTITGGFPNLRRPRVLWWGIEGGGELLELQKRLDGRMKALGFEPEEKTFHPHLTVGRVNEFSRESGLAARFGELKLEAIRWRAEEVNVMSSVLRPTGAEYTALGRLKLGAG